MATRKAARAIDRRARVALLAHGSKDQRLLRTWEKRLFARAITAREFYLGSLMGHPLRYRKTTFQNAPCAPPGLRWRICQAML